jgi:hypothetical protein
MQLRRIILTLLVVVMLITCLAGAVFASYQGIGIRQVGPSTVADPSVRSGSLFGPGITGGGPGSGK